MHWLAMGTPWLMTARERFEKDWRLAYLKNLIVGKPLISWRWASFSSAVQSTLASLISLPSSFNWAAADSYSGASFLQWPHLTPGYVDDINKPKERRGGCCTMGHRIQRAHTDSVGWIHQMNPQWGSPQSCPRHASRQTGQTNRWEPKKQSRICWDQRSRASFVVVWWWPSLSLPAPPPPPRLILFDYSTEQ